MQGNLCRVGSERRRLHLPGTQRRPWNGNDNPATRGDIAGVLFQVLAFQLLEEASSIASMTHGTRRLRVD
jgi:hypothetical protein